VDGNYEIFEGWIQKVNSQIKSGEESQVVIKCLNTFAKLPVRAKISDSKDDLSNPAPLRVVNDLGEKKDQMFIEILEEMDGEMIVELGGVES